MAKGLTKYVGYNEVFEVIFHITGPGKSFVIPRTSLYRVSLIGGSTVLTRVSLETIFRSPGEGWN